MSSARSSIFAIHLTSVRAYDPLFSELLLLLHFLAAYMGRGAARNGVILCSGRIAPTKFLALQIDCLLYLGRFYVRPIQLRPVACLLPKKHAPKIHEGEFELTYNMTRRRASRMALAKIF